MRSPRHVIRTVASDLLQRGQHFRHQFRDPRVRWCDFFAESKHTSCHKPPIKISRLRTRQARMKPPPPPPESPESYAFKGFGNPCRVDESWFKMRPPTRSRASRTWKETPCLATWHKVEQAGLKSYRALGIVYIYIYMQSNVHIYRYIYT